MQFVPNYNEYNYNVLKTILHKHSRFKALKKQMYFFYLSIIFLVSEEDAKFFLDNKESVDLESFINNCWNTVKPYILMNAAEYKPPINDSKKDESEFTEKRDDWYQKKEGKF